MASRGLVYMRGTLSISRILYSPAVLTCYLLASPAWARHHTAVAERVDFWQTIPKEYFIGLLIVGAAVVLFFLVRTPDCNCRCGSVCKCKCKCSSTCACRANQISHF